MRSTTGLAAQAADEALRVWPFERRDLRSDDVAVRITFCGVCHTDLHAWHGEPAYGEVFPLVPGHEFVGVVSEVGADVHEFKAGDPVAVGNIIDSCGICMNCTSGFEQGCQEFPTLTYGGQDRRDHRPTYGAYSTEYVLTERFVYHLPDGLDPAGAAPLMCAGVTVWEPLERANLGPGVSVGVVGLGGLGHLAVKFAAALGAQVDVFTTSAAKEADAKALGARTVVLSTDPGQMGAASGRYDYILDTISVPHDLSGYFATLKVDGTLCVVGSLEEMTVDPMTMLRRSLTVSGGGGRPGTQRMLDFCGQHGITSDVEILPAAKVNDAFSRLARNDVRFRFSLDMTTLD